MNHSGSPAHLGGAAPPDNWDRVTHRTYHQLRLHALEAMSERLTTAGRHGEAVAAGQASVRAEPLRESTHRALVNAHLGADNQGAALREYVQCRRVLLDELGLEPSVALRNLLPRVTRSSTVA